MTKFAVQYALVSDKSVFIFDSHCSNCDTPVNTLIEVSAFEERSRRESAELRLSGFDHDELKKMNIKW
jgi:hypothetical protein